MQTQSSTIAKMSPAIRQQANAETMTLIQNAANLVNAGSYYRSLEKEKAFRYYKAALDVLQSVTSGDGFNPDQFPYNELSADYCAQAAIPYESGQEEHFLSLQDGSYFIYCKPFLFNQANLDVAFTPLYIATTIFDMALMLHKAGIHSDKNLNKSLRLYDMSLMLLRNAPQQLDCSNLMLAILNNRTHVYYTLQRFQEAELSMEEFSDLLTAVFDDETSIFDEPELSGMVLNTLLPPDPSRLAPAA
jgi:tetratricopeptide (TPR) repeat protein